MEREEILLDLINYDSDLSIIEKKLKWFPWDSEKELVCLTKQKMVDILTRYIYKDISINDLIYWASIIENREDIWFEDDSIQELIFFIANPDINGSFSIAIANEFLNKMRKNDLLI